MSRALYLVRHAIAEVRTPSARDEDRRLTAEGAAKMQRAARGLRALGVAPDAVWCSPYLRTVETAALLCAELASELTPEPYAPLAPGGGSAAVLQGLRAARGLGSLMLVGHEPDLGELAASLVAGAPAQGAFAFKKGGAAAFEVASFPPPRASARLRWFLTPKQLRALG